MGGKISWREKGEDNSARAWLFPVQLTSLLIATMEFPPLGGISFSRSEPVATALFKTFENYLVKKRLNNIKLRRLISLASNRVGESTGKHPLVTESNLHISSSFLGVRRNPIQL